MQNSGIFISVASASSDLAVTSDCGHSLRFTPRRWRRGQTSTWRGYSKVTTRPVVMVTADGGHRKQTTTGRDRPVALFYFSATTEFKNEEREKLTKNSLKTKELPGVTGSTPSGFSLLLTSWPHPIISLSLPRGRAVWNLFVCVRVYGRIKERDGMNDSIYTDLICDVH